MQRWGVRFLLSLTFFSGGVWAETAEINTIVKVEARGSTVEIVGSKKPSFTTFTMTDPPRLVIDIAEAVFSGVADQVPGSGSVSWIKTASYGSDASAIARVLIAFSKEVETDLTSAGNKLVVKILDAPAPAVARAGKSAATPRVEAAAQESKPVEAPPQLQLATGAEASATPPAAEPGRGKQEAKLKDAFAKAQQEGATAEDAKKEAAQRAESERQEQNRRAQAEKQRQEEEKARVAEQERAAAQQRLAQAEQSRREAAAEAKRQAEEERLAREKAKAEAEEAKRQAAAEQKRQAQEERLAKAKAKAEQDEAKRQAAAERKRQAEEERLASEKAKADAEEAKRQAAAEQKRQADEERVAKTKAKAEQDEMKLQAAAEEKRKAEDERRARAEAKAQAEEAKRQAAAERKRQAHEARLSQQRARDEAAQAKRQAIAVRKSKPARSSSRATMTFVGFERAASGSRVYVRTSGPVQYSVQEDGDKRVVLELENTRIALRNNRRPLDTSFFDSAVAMVAPTSAGSSTVRVEIKLKERASFQAKQDGNEVSVEFSRTPHP